MHVYRASCHCGAVEVEITKAEPISQLIDCNCSVCTKKGIIHTPVQDHEFRLVTGEDALTLYQFGTGEAEHPFCKHCGIHVFGRPRSNPERRGVNARCLDDFEAIMKTVTPLKFDGQNHPKDQDAPVT